MAHILVVEDDRLIREMIVHFLQEESYQADAAATGDQAIELLAADTFDLIVTDVVMPGKTDGLALIRYVRDNYPATRVLCVTGYAELKHRIAVDDPWCRTLNKPFRLSELRRSIEGELASQAESRRLDCLTRVGSR